VFAVKLLLTKGAKTSAVDCYGLTSLHVAVQRARDEPMYYEVARVLINGGQSSTSKQLNGAPLEARTPGTLLTPLALSVGTGDVRTVRLLLREGANPNSADRRDCTPLHHALHHARVRKEVLDRRRQWREEELLRRSGVGFAGKAATRLSLHEEAQETGYQELLSRLRRAVRNARALACFTGRDMGASHEEACLLKPDLCFGKCRGVEAEDSSGSAVQNVAWDGAEHSFFQAADGDWTGAQFEREQHFIKVQFIKVAGGVWERGRA
jgi:hypothetical protein